MTRDAAMMAVEFSTAGDVRVSPEQVQAARRRVASLGRHVPQPPPGARLTLRRANTRARRRYVADASLPYAGRVVAAHATGRTALEAADEVVSRMRRQLRRIVGAEAAPRDEPRVVRRAIEARPTDLHHRPEVELKPPEEREIVHRRTYADGPEATLSALADMLDLDEDFHLFRHARTAEDVLVFWRDDRRVGLIHPPGSVLADETDVVVPTSSRYSDPVTLDTAREDMDLLNHRFLYFVAAEDGRGKVIYLRHDGDYGLVEPE